MISALKQFNDLGHTFVLLTEEAADVLMSIGVDSPIPRRSKYYQCTECMMLLFSSSTPDYEVYLSAYSPIKKDIFSTTCRDIVIRDIIL